MSSKAGIKSFQNCTETDVPGYNDCPSFLYQVSKSAAKSGRRNRIEHKVRDVSGNTTISALPPPSKTLRVSKTSSEAFSEADHYSREQLLEKIQHIYGSQSSLSPREFEFYRRKVDLNITNSLENESTRHVLTSIFKQLDDKKKCSLALKEWLASDITIASWCPAFLKIYENASCANLSEQS